MDEYTVTTVNGAGSCELIAWVSIAICAHNSLMGTCAAKLFRPAMAMPQTLQWAFWDAQWHKVCTDAHRYMA